MLSRTVALPVIVGAAALKAARIRRRGLPAGEGTGLVIGTGTSFASTLASQALIKLVERDSALWPYAAYRAGLASLVLAKLWKGRRRTPAHPQRGAVASPASSDGPPTDGNGASSWIQPATGQRSRPA
jgi:hypothetical protein